MMWCDDVFCLWPFFSLIGAKCHMPCVRHDFFTEPVPTATATHFAFIDKLKSSTSTKRETYFPYKKFLLHEKINNI